MKQIFQIFIIILFVLPKFALAQTPIAKSKIALVGRFHQKNIEIRWIPDNKTVLRLGFNSSYTVQRSDSGMNNFTTIAITKAYSQLQWDSILNNETNEETLKNLSIAADFLFAPNTDKKNISLDEGIGELNDQKSKEELNYLIFLFTAIKDSKVANALGLGFIDNGIIAGKTYIYKIIFNGKSPIYEIENGMVTVKASANPDQYKNEVFVYPGDKKLSFVWSSNPKLSGYFVERRTEGQNVFIALNTAPIYASSANGFESVVNGSFTEDSLKNYTTYYYRFYGLTAFGEKVLFAEVKGMPKDLTPPSNPIIYQPKHVKTKEVLVKWDLFGDVSDLKGFIVARSDRDTGVFTLLHKKLLPPKSRNFTDTTFNPEGINYYLVYAMDTSGNISYSYPAYVAIVDSTPPVKPQIISAIVDSSGVVTIVVKKGTEKDLKGYRLFKSNSPEHEFSVIQEGFLEDKWDTNILKTKYMDTITLQSLTPNIYYRIKALDYHYNQSVFSDIAIVKRPDTIPPVTPLINDVIVGEKQIEIHFVPSESVDVKAHFVYRKTDFAAAWDIISIIDSNQKTLIDTNVTIGTMYYYSMRAKDESNLFSGYANPVSGKPYDSGIRPPINNFTVAIVDKKAVLKWSYPPIYKDVYFVIYKWDGNGQLTQYAKTSDQTFVDSNTKQENSYSIKAFTNDGGKSKMSEELFIKLE